MPSRRPRRSVGGRILLGLARVLATAIIAVAASAALAGLHLRPVDFSRILPVILTGEGILYILVLGGGAVAGPVLLLTVALAFALRFGIATAAATVSPHGGGDLIAGAQFYWASYWPAAVAQVLLVTLLLRLIKPLIARRRRRPRPRRSQEPAEEVDDERRELLLAALDEAPDEPPESPTALEEQQIGDLAEVAQPPAESGGEEGVQELALPLDDREPEPEGPAAAEKVPSEAASDAADEEAEEPPLPPGVIDATPQVVHEREESSEPQPHEPEPDTADEEAAPPVELPERPAPVEDTATLEPVAAQEPTAGVDDLVPSEKLREMADAIAPVAGADADVRAWATRGGRSLVATLPPATPAAAAADHAGGLVRAHLGFCQWLGMDVTSGHLCATARGAWALQALEEEGSVFLLMAGRGESAAGRLELAADRAADALRAIVAPLRAPVEAVAPSGPEAPAPDAELAAVINDASLAEGGALAGGWACYRTAEGHPVAVAAPPGMDAGALAGLAAEAAASLAGFADALTLGSPRWLTVQAPRSAAALTWHRLGGERLLLVALTDRSGAVARTRWEMQRIAARAGAQ